MSAAQNLRPPQLVATASLESSTGHKLPTNSPIRAIQSLESNFLQMRMHINYFCEPEMPIWLVVILAACHAETPTARSRPSICDPCRDHFSPSEGPISTIKGSAGMYIQSRVHSKHFHDLNQPTRPMEQLPLSGTPVKPTERPEQTESTVSHVLLTLQNSNHS